MESDRLLSSRTSILDRRQRKTTDLLFLITLQFFILTWVSIVSYALSEGDITKFLSSGVVQQITNTLTISRTFIIIGYSILSVIFFQLFLLFPQTNKITGCTILWQAFYGAELAAIICYHYFHFVTLYIAVLFLCGIPFLFCLLRWECISLPAKIIDESMKAIRFFTYTPMLFSIFWYILCLLPLLFGLVVQAYLMSITQSDGITMPAHVWFFSFINIISSAWLFLFLFNIGQMALCGTFATWFWTEDKCNISRFTTIFRCLKTTAMYHLGTVAYGSSLFGISRTLTAMLKIFIQKLGEGFNLRFSLLIVYNIIDMIICRFIMYSTIVTCAVHGKRFSQSIEDAIDYLTRKPVRCLMMLKVTEYTMLLMYVPFTILPQLCAIFAYIFTVEPIESNIMFGFIIFCYHIFMLPLLSMFFAASNTIFLCFLEDVDRNEDIEEKHYTMSPELQSLLEYSTLEESGESSE